MDDLEWVVENLSMQDFVFVMNEVAEAIKKSSSQGASDEQWRDSQAMDVVEEAGEFIAEYRRLKGFARRAGDREAMLSELADVVIAAMVMFWNLDADAQHYIQKKLVKIVTRGFVNKEEPQ
jgi:NTP pyrophosphatase (non-canonical NTP hydrolase)